MIIAKVTWATIIENRYVYYPDYATAEKRVPVTFAIFPVLEIFDHSGNNLSIVAEDMATMYTAMKFSTVDDPIKAAREMFGEAAVLEVQKFLKYRAPTYWNMVDKYVQVYY